MSGQVMNLRTGIPFVAGNQDTVRAYEQKVLAAKAKQRTRYAVAPKASVTTPLGKRLGEGEAVTLEDLQGDRRRDARILLRDYLISGHILEADGFGGGHTPPAAA